MRTPIVEHDGWQLVSAEERHRENPQSFEIPTEAQRGSLKAGDAAKLLFYIETKSKGNVIDRGIDRMWVIVKARSENGYEGILDSDPGEAENLRLRNGDTVLFRPEHIAAIEIPPRDYVIKKYGEDFFAEDQ